MAVIFKSRLYTARDKSISSSPFNVFVPLTCCLSFGVQSKDFLPASAHGGFDFSATEIARRRDRRYKIACNYHFRDRSNVPRPDLGSIIDVKAA
jgi:hypothetical protein